jgi:hypothetical protein
MRNSFHTYCVFVCATVAPCALAALAFAPGEALGECLADWTQRSPQNSPSPRFAHAAAYDSRRGVTVVFGGCLDPVSGPMVADTWEWDGANWIQRTPPVSPPARAYHAMAFDSGRGVTVLFGGTDGQSYRGDTWEWDGSNWIQRTPPVSPPPRMESTMAYDSARQVTVLADGSWGGVGANDTWEWDGTNWTDRTPDPLPPDWPRRYGHAMSFDSARGVTVLFGGYAEGVDDDHTWEWDGANWEDRTPESPAASPSARHHHAMTFDGGRGVSVLFGGNANSYLQDDTWEWNGDGWMHRVTATAPGARIYHAMAYDSRRGVVVLFGGWSYPGSVLDDTWEFQAPLWISQQPVDTSVVEGSDTGLYVEVVSPEAVVYQWRKDNTPIPGATRPFLRIPGAGQTNAGVYDVVVSGATCGQLISAPAWLTVNLRQDFDDDGDVDLTDYGEFLDCYNGPNKPPACS